MLKIWINIPFVNPEDIKNKLVIWFLEHSKNVKISMNILYFKRVAWNIPKMSRKYCNGSVIPNT